MGSATLHCSGCGTRLAEADFSAGSAFRVNDRPFCRACAGAALSPPEPQGGGRNAPEPAPAPLKPRAQRSATTRRVKDSAPEKSRSTGAILVGLGMAAVVLVVAIAALSGGAGDRRMAERGPEPVRMDPRGGPVSPLRTEPAPSDAGARARTDVRGDPLKAELEALDREVAEPRGKEDFSQALLILEMGRERHRGPAWTDPIDLRCANLRKSIQELHASLREKSREARVRGDEAEVKSLVDRVRKWGLPPYLEDLQRVVASARSAAPAPAEPPAPAATPEPAPSPAPPRTPPVPTFQAKIDQAIASGAEWLKHAAPPAGSEELMLLTFVHAGVPETEPRFKEYIERMLQAPLQKTYPVALQAMILEELQRVKHQARIAQCAQFLVDNQCLNGQWSYGEPDPMIAGTPTGLGLKTASTSESSTAGIKPKVVNIFTVQKKKSGPARGDNSNSQYAALGLRACYDSGVRPSEGVVKRAMSWWYESQHGGSDKEKRPAVATGASEGVPRGWCYDGNDAHNAYGSMTAGAAGALVIYNHMLRADWRKDHSVQDGMAWLAKNFTVNANPGPCQHDGRPNVFLGYYLYGLERAGMLYDTERIGGHAWYDEGAKFLVGAQHPDGSWLVSHDPNHAAWDTCFAILFLKRATRPLVASEDDRKKPGDK